MTTQKESGQMNKDDLIPGQVYTYESADSPESMKDNLRNFAKNRGLSLPEVLRD